MAQRLLHAHALAHLVRDPDGNQFTVVIGQETVAFMFQLVAPGVIIGDLTVMHDGHIRKRAGPERVAGIGAYIGFGGQARVAQPVGADHVAHAMFVCHRIGAAGILDDLERAPDRLHLKPFANLIGVCGPAGHIRGVADHEAG